MKAVVHKDNYSDAGREQGITEYNRELEQYYIKRGLQTPPQAWTQPIAEKFGGPRRMKLREYLKVKSHT